MRARETIELTPVGLPRADQGYRPFIAASLLLATLVGFVLGIHVPVERLLDAGSPERSADLVQAHGQAQLLGFAGLFVMGMSLRLMPRFAGSRIAFEPLMQLTLGLFIAGLVMRAVVMPWSSGDVHAALLLVSLISMLAGSVCFLFVVSGTLAVEARRFDASSVAFLCGAALLFLACFAALGAAIDIAGEARTLPYLADNAILQLELDGFLLSFILGVALRAIPTMVGIERPGRSAGVLAVALAAAVAVLAAAMLFLQYVSYRKPAVLAADAAFAAFGLVLLVLAWQSGVLRQAANRIRPASQPNLWLIRSAFVWLVVAGALAVFTGARSLLNAELPGQFDFDAVRHSLGVGVVTILITGMSMMILPEFAAERQRRHRQHELAYLLAGLLNAAAVLRVVPSLAGTSWSFDERNLSMAVAGSLAEVGLLVFTVYLLRLLLRPRIS